MFLVIDNYDSFTYNLVQYVMEIVGAENVLVFRNREIDTEKIYKIEKEKPIEGIIISPGPGHPKDIPNVLKIIKKFGENIPILGVCLGHQAIGYAFGCSVVNAREVVHGKLRQCLHDGKGIFQGIPQPIRVMRYHSLVVRKEDLANSPLIVTASTIDGEVMGIRHKKYPVEGVQFHPESIFTEHGFDIVKNFIHQATLFIKQLNKF
ncbi:MAG: aminodeoxychorismate/anthranilate synthase component II [Fervidobacterium sp.]|nr:aminodeoxychorismate/anthranilate synthase component II [Fervidobacterium sp.]